MLDYIKENAGNVFFWLGFILIFFGVAIFFGAKPKHMGATAIGESWFVSAPLVVFGAVALAFDRYLHR
jgi:uncharacterized membrane protein